ncbi:MAG: hypothetical protein EP344_00865 [Bacteroidetes bacterium]|nr:MAG: hypothetical protein EP344_00865 [Bacteroidota bacterium]
MKILNWILAILFALFAAVQYNDPDPFQWILLYGGVAVFYMLAAAGRVYRWAVWAWLVWIVIWAGLLLPEFSGWIQMGTPSIVESMKTDKPYIEFAREFLGLLIAAAGCGWLLWRGSRPATA